MFFIKYKSEYLNLENVISIRRWGEHQIQFYFSESHIISWKYPNKTARNRAFASFHHILPWKNLKYANHLLASKTKE